MDIFQKLNPYFTAMLAIALAEYAFVLWLYIRFRIQYAIDTRLAIPGLQTNSHGAVINNTAPKLNRSITKRAKKRR